ncbi:MAG: phosphoglycerate dehydrogenase [Bacteroidota bacterium]
MEKSQTLTSATPIHIVLDFDSTFIQVETMEELADIALDSRQDKAAILSQIQALTQLGLVGKIPYNESLNRRLKLIKAHRDHLSALIDRLKKRISVSINRNKSFFQENKDQIYIISQSFKDVIWPVVEGFGIKESNVFGNSFVFDEEGNITGVTEENPLAHSLGKAKVLESLKLEGNVQVIGDAITDLQMKEKGLADTFFVFTENVYREGILGQADHITPSFDEFLFVNQIPGAISFPKNRIKVLLLENIHPFAEDAFRQEGYQVEIIGRALSEDELCEKIKDVSIIGIRSKTHITEKVLAHANRLLVIGAFCIGTNQIDLGAASERGVVVFNAPYSNTRSVVELALGEMIMLMRRIPSMNAGMHRGVWNKSAKESYEIRGKRLGIIGYGNIGAQLSVLAEAMGMQVYYYDLIEKLALGNAVKIGSLRDLLSVVDVVSLHVDGRQENQLLIGEEELAAMKPGAILLNLSRGKVVDIPALVKYLKNGHLRGAALDVYPLEPKSNQDEFVSELLGLDNVILTPHIGGSTQEAQQNIAQYVPARITDYINSGNSYGSVNFPEAQISGKGHAHRLLHIHHNVPGVMSKITQAMADHEVNIEGQTLKTNEQIGYLIMDINQDYDTVVLDKLRTIEHTIRFRVLY